MATIVDNTLPSKPSIAFIRRTVAMHVAFNVDGNRFSVNYFTGSTLSSSCSCPNLIIQSMHGWCMPSNRIRTRIALVRRWKISLILCTLQQLIKVYDITDRVLWVTGPVETRSSLSSTLSQPRFWTQYKTFWSVDRTNLCPVHSPWDIPFTLVDQKADEIAQFLGTALGIHSSRQWITQIVFELPVITKTWRITATEIVQ